MLKIFGRANSINVQKVMWLIAELNLEHERIDMGMQYGGNDTAEYKALNPMGLIPALQDGDFVLWESHAIVRYIAEAYGSQPWWPADAAGRGKASQWMDWYLAHVHAPMSVIFRTLIRTPEAERNMAAVDAAVREMGQTWSLLDRHLADNDFVLGTEPTIGDIPVGCYVYRWYNMDIERPDLPNLAAWYDRLNSRATYQEHVMLPIT